jgi:hypothetical protein
MDTDDFVTLSINREIALSADNTWDETLRRFLSSYVDALREGGCTMVGHIKGMLTDGESPPLFFSATSLDREAQFKGGPLRVKSPLSLSMTVIVAGIGEDKAASLLETALDRYL